MVKELSDSYSFRLAARVLLHASSHRIIHTTAFVTLVVDHWLEREIAQYIHPMKDRSDDLSHHERTLLPRSYISLLDSDSDVLIGKHEFHRVCYQISTLGVQDLCDFLLFLIILKSVTFNSPLLLQTSCLDRK